MYNIRTIEREVLEKLRLLFGAIGFSVELPSFANSKWFPDFVVSKRYAKESYKIGVELKTYKKADRTLSDVIRQLIMRVENDVSFDKLVLLLDDSQMSKRERDRLLLSNINLLRNPTKTEIKFLSELEQWVDEIKIINSKEFEKDSVMILFKNLCSQLIYKILEHPDALQALEWRDLERVLAEIFEKMNFNVTLTPCSKDGGKDIILDCEVDSIKKHFIIEVKHWSSNEKVGSSIVKQFVQVVVNEKQDKGLLLSTYGFTKKYYETLTEFERTKINFGDQDKIVDLCKAYERIDNGLWLPTNLNEELLRNTISWEI